MARPGSAPDERMKQLLVGLAAILAVASVIAVLWLGRYLPGMAGEWFAMVMGVATTPFLMEASLFVLCFVIVIGINHWRLHREGDELVYLDQAQGPGSETLPEKARWAIYPEPPLNPESPDLFDQAEGALAIQDSEGALEAIRSMSDAERDSPRGLTLRISLARATGREDLARRLEAKRRS